MRLFLSFLPLLNLILPLVWLIKPIVAISPITRTGKYLYDSNGTRFYIKGVAYQPQGTLAASSTANTQNGGFPEPSSFVDPLSSSANCTRDLPYLKQLGVNAIRVYSVNSTLNHDACMSMFSNAGIYVLIDRASPSWSTNLLNEYISTIDAFRGYDNLLAFNVGNEVITEVSNTNAAPFVKAAARDVKAYLHSVNSTALVGYAAVDGDPDFRNTLAEYLTCGNDSITVDLYGLNNYEWCGNETLQSSNWDIIVDGFSTIPVATYMSEFGCITNPPRLWTEVSALLASPVSDVFSGGVAFSYFPTNGGYGMVNISSDGTQVITSSDFTRLSAEYNSTSGPNSPSESSSTILSTSCPAQNASLLASTNLPPTPDESVCNCINVNALACHVTQLAASQPIIIGELTDYACSLLESTNSGASCNAIAGNGTSGVYGQLAMCSPAIKLSYAMSAYWEYNPIASSCSFAGNATLNATTPNTAQDASTAAESCLASEPSGGVFTPTALSTVSQVSATSTLASSSASSSSKSSTGSIRSGVSAWAAVGGSVVIGIGAVIGAWVVL